ncbi:MAG TPA: hypothetical protein PK899_05160, partial [Spirochaetota bacterium]|nr:hypothetical protein [Spirochaetota bacterium]
CPKGRAGACSSICVNFYQGASYRVAYAPNFPSTKNRQDTFILNKNSCVTEVIVLDCRNEF